MKEVIRYQCECCGTVFDSQEDCEDCENRHFGVEEAKYEYAAGEAFPHYITVKFDGGQIREHVMSAYV